MVKRGLIVAVLGAALLVAGCGRPVVPVAQVPTEQQAIRAFDAMYPGFKGSSAESSAGTWIVTGASAIEGDSHWAVPVRVPVRVAESGIAKSSVDGVAWAGSVDLIALTEQRPAADGDSIDYQLENFMSTPGSVVTGVSRTSTGSVIVSIVAGSTVRPPLVFTWDADGGWTIDAVDVASPQTPIDSLPAQRPGLRPSRSEITAVVRQFVFRLSTRVKVATVSAVKIARDTQGRWWVSAFAVPVDTKRFDEATVYLRKSGAVWELVDLGTGIEKSELPKDVRAHL